jgi:hypothetical protein
MNFEPVEQERRNTKLLPLILVYFIFGKSVQGTCAAACPHLSLILGNVIGIFSPKLLQKIANLR